MSMWRRQLLGDTIAGAAASSQCAAVDTAAAYQKVRVVQLMCDMHAERQLLRLPDSRACIPAVRVVVSRPLACRAILSSNRSGAADAGAGSAVSTLPC
jgi:hypothetical protein